MARRSAAFSRRHKAKVRVPLLCWAFFDILVGWKDANYSSRGSPCPALISKPFAAWSREPRFSNGSDWYPPSVPVTRFLARVLGIDPTRRKAVHSRQIQREMRIRVSNAAPRVTRSIGGRPREKQTSTPRPWTCVKSSTLMSRGFANGSDPCSGLRESKGRTEKRNPYLLAVLHPTKPRLTHRFW